jgi:hypothetical protein
MINQLNVLFYGNCQLGSIKDFILFDKNNYNVNITYIECFSTTLSDSEFDSVIKNNDIIITQPICDNYRNMYYLSSNYIVNKCNPNCKIIFINNLYFDFYYINTSYSKDNTNINCNNLCYEFHDIKEAFDKKIKIYYVLKNYINNINYKNKDELLSIAKNSILQLKQRYDNMLQYSKEYTYFIPISDYIKNNYRDKLLFYSPNHPTKILTHHISKKIIDKLNVIGIKCHFDYDNHVDHFDYFKCIIYSCIQPCVNFNIDDHEPYVNGETDVYKIVELYYNYYKNL